MAKHKFATRSPILWPTAWHDVLQHADDPVLEAVRENIDRALGGRPLRPWPKAPEILRRVFVSVGWRPGFVYDMGFREDMALARDRISEQLLDNQRAAAWDESEIGGNR